MDKKEFIEFNAKDGLKGFDPTKAINDPAIRSILLDTGYMDKDIKEYIEAKKQCEDRSGNWKQERGQKHYEMAKAFAIAMEKLENKE